ncbi:sesquipedalian-1-like [Leuresthes tenuis]|uniref:sesquipedalian-1-like n=1 Tax=Leuresthes tenuis TaxID=355514 RepID=UPI003B5079CE
MKIDEKVVSYFESCNSQVDKEGYLSKKGEIKTSYQKRWFVLKGNLLFYKDRAADRDLIGVIVLEGCTVQLCESEEKFAFSLVWSEPGLRTYKFAAEDQASQESWIKALLSASHSYLALLVLDMEKKYRDALDAFPGEPGKSFTMPNFSTAPADHQAAYLSARSSTLSLYTAQAAGAAPSQLLQPQSISSSRATSKRSPKLWPKRNANVAPASTPPLPVVEYSGFCLGTQEDFSKLHEDFGKEIKELIADWSKRGHVGEGVQEENLIDFGL